MGRGVEKGPIFILALGLTVLTLGIMRFVRAGHFSLIQGAYCLIAIPVVLLVILIADYTLHHARIAFLIVLAFLVLLAVASPSFCVGLGVGLVGIVLTQWRR